MPSIRLRTFTLAFTLAFLLALPKTSAGQERAPDEQPSTVQPGSPEEAATLFIGSVRGIRWDLAARFMAPEALRRFRTSVVMISDPDSTGDLRSHLVQTDSLGMRALSDEDVFSRAIGVVLDDMPGLMHALYDRDDEVLGHVREPADPPSSSAQPELAHVVYRTTARLSGAVPEVKVMQLVHAADGWRVRWSDELDLLEAALRGVGR